MRVVASRALTRISAGQETPADIARGLAKRARSQTASGEGAAWRRESYTLKRGEARVKARAYFAKFPKAAYMTEIESWPHRIHNPPLAQRRLIARKKEHCFPNASPPAMIVEPSTRERGSRP